MGRSRKSDMLKSLRNAVLEGSPMLSVLMDMSGSSVRLLQTNGNSICSIFPVASFFLLYGRVAYDKTRIPTQTPAHLSIGCFQLVCFLLRSIDLPLQRPCSHSILHPVSYQHRSCKSCCCCDRCCCDRCCSISHCFSQVHFSAPVFSNFIMMKS